MEMETKSIWYDINGIKFQIIYNYICRYVRNLENILYFISTWRFRKCAPK